MLKNNIKLVFCNIIILCSLFFLTACHEKQDNFKRNIDQVQQEIAQLNNLLKPVNLVHLKLPDLKFSDIANPFEAKIITQTITSLSTFLHKSWQVQGYVKYHHDFSSVFIRSESGSRSSSQSEIMLLSLGDKLFDHQWVVEQISQKSVVFFNKSLGKEVSKEFAAPLAVISYSLRK